MKEVPLGAEILAKSEMMACTVFSAKQGKAASLSGQVDVTLKMELMAMDEQERQS